MASFAGITFNEAGSDGSALWFPHFEGPAVGQYKRIAGGTLVYQRPAGAGADEKLSLPIQIDTTIDPTPLNVLANLMNAKGTTATLTTEDFSRSATLDDVTGIRIYRSQAVVFATLVLTGR